MNCGIATCLNRATGMAGLSPAGLQPCRLLRPPLVIVTYLEFLEAYLTSDGKFAISAYYLKFHRIGGKFKIAASNIELGDEDFHCFVK